MIKLSDKKLQSFKTQYQNIPNVIKPLPFYCIPCGMALNQKQVIIHIFLDHKITERRTNETQDLA